jgi:hypothetical protein
MTRLSNRQFPLLEAFDAVEYMTLDEAAAFDQRPFRSFLIRKYIAWKPSRGFHITQAGKDARKEFYNTDIIRANPNLPLTAYFDPTAYGLKPRAKARRATRPPAVADNVRDFISQKAG